MTKEPVTPAVRVLREHNVSYEPLFYTYVERGGTAESSRALGLDEHHVVKTIVLQDDAKKPCIVLMHGDRDISAKNLARLHGKKSYEPCAPDAAQRWTGYMVGGTSPFGVKTAMPIYAEATILDLPWIAINGGKRGFLVKLAPNVLRTVLHVELVSVAQ